MSVLTELVALLSLLAKEGVSLVETPNISVFVGRPNNSCWACEVTSGRTKAAICSEDTIDGDAAAEDVDDRMDGAVVDAVGGVVETSIEEIMACIETNDFDVRSNVFDADAAAEIRVLLPRVMSLPA